MTASDIARLESSGAFGSAAAPARADSAISAK
jgi:hypothetical protein